VACVCYDIYNFVIFCNCLFLSYTLHYRKLHKTFSIDGQWLRNHAIKFARWQHRAVGRGTRFVVIFISLETH